MDRYEDINGGLDVSLVTHVLQAKYRLDGYILKPSTCAGFLPYLAICEMLLRMPSSSIHTYNARNGSNYKTIVPCVAVLFAGRMLPYSKVAHEHAGTDVYTLTVGVSALFV